MHYETISVRPMTSRIGAEVHDIDLSKALRNRQVEEIHDALMQHSVIFFRDQHLDHESQRALALKFGKLVPPYMGAVEGFPEIGRMHADANSTRIVGEWWHTDHSCDEIPPMATMLYLPIVPEVGGDTLFSSMYAAYDALSPRMKVYLEGLTAIHDAPAAYSRYDPKDFPNLRGKYPVNSHPVICTHPVTKKKLIFVNEQYTTRINEVSIEESRAILGYLAQHCANANFQVRFRWRPHSVAFWDNRCTQHQAIWDYYPQTRSGFRIVIAGDSKPC
jgi:taurine dioxygenase